MLTPSKDSPISCGKTLTLHDGIRRAEKQSFAALQGKIASWWIPDEVRVDPLEGGIPLTATGKISKKELRKHLSSTMQAKL